MRPIAIMGAIQEELAGLKQALQNTHTISLGSRQVTTGTWHGQQLVLALSHIGKVAAATTATALIERFDVSEMVFTGVAGGLGPGVNVGDMVVATEFLQHDMDVLRELHVHSPQVHTGMVVSGDRFVSTTAESQDLQARQPKALAVEMEGAAVAQVCHDYGVPFGAVRTISDRADDSATVDFSRFIHEVASRYTLALLGTWLGARAIA